MTDEADDLVNGDETSTPSTPEQAQSAARQTLSHLRGLFEKHGISPRKQLGQNFLIDLNLHEVILREAGLTPNDIVLEVGTGTGALTERMADQAAAVVAVEIDPAMGRLTAETIGPRPNVLLLRQDALRNKNNIANEVLDALRSSLKVRPGRRIKLVANLPYSIATPLVSNLLLDDELRPALMVIMIQWEMAERLMAEPTGSAYGSISVLVNALADVEILRRIPPTVFWPRPKVDSAIVRIMPSVEKRRKIDDLPWFAHVVRQVFLHRRKNLRVVLHAMYHHADAWTKPVVDEILEQLDLPFDIRAEALNVEELDELSKALRVKLDEFGIPPITDDRKPKTKRNWLLKQEANANNPDYVAEVDDEEDDEDDDETDLEDDDQE